MHLIRHNVELRWPRGELRERRRQFVAILEEALSTEHVETEARTREGDHETSDVTQVTNRLGTDEREEDVVVLLTLESTQPPRHPQVPNNSKMKSYATEE